MAINSSATPQGKQRRHASGYEERDAHAPWIFGIVAGLLIAGIAVHFGIAAMMRALEKTPAPSDRWSAGQSVLPSIRSGAPTAPRIVSGARPKLFPKLQLAPAADLKTFRAREDEELNSYGWVNKTAAVARIPIQRAMKLLLQRGLPTRQGTNSGAAGPSNYQLLQQRPRYSQPEIQTPK